MFVNGFFVFFITSRIPSEHYPKTQTSGLINKERHSLYNEGKPVPK